MCASSKKGPTVQDDVLMLEGRRIMGMVYYDGNASEVNNLSPDKHISSLTFHLPDGVFILIMGAFLG